VLFDLAVVVTDVTDVSVSESIVWRLPPRRHNAEAGSIAHQAHADLGRALPFVRSIRT
jgi:hypothetical protein